MKHYVITPLELIAYATVSVTVSDFVASNVDVTVIVTVPLTPASICTTPPSVIVTPSVSLAYTTVLGANPVVTTVVVSCNEEFAETVAVAGVTVTLETVGVVGTYTSAFSKGDVEKVFH